MPPMDPVDPFDGTELTPSSAGSKKQTGDPVKRREADANALQAK